VSERLRFTKMSGAGNDFVVVGADEARRLGRKLPGWVRGVCRRGLSVGADGVLVVEPAGTGRVRVRFYNPDGAPAFCGNGSRCAARYARAHDLAGDAMVLETALGDVPARVRGGRVRLELPAPEDRGRAAFELAATRIEGRSVLVGVPHFVAFAAGIASAPLHVWGPGIRTDPSFGDAGTNVDLAEWEEDGSLRVRTWERGVEAETLSCGSGAVAAAWVARLESGAGVVRVLPASGVPIEVSRADGAAGEAKLFLESDARFVFEACLDPEATGGFDP